MRNMFPYHSMLLPSPPAATTSSAARVPTLGTLMANQNDRVQHQPIMTWPAAPHVHLPTGSGFMFNPQLALRNVVPVPVTTGLHQLKYAPSAIITNNGMNSFIPLSTPVSFAETICPPPRGVSPFGLMLGTFSNGNHAQVQQPVNSRPNVVMQSDDSSVGSSSVIQQHGKWPVDRPSKRPRPLPNDNRESDDGSTGDEEEYHSENSKDGTKISLTKDGDSPTKSEKLFGEKRLIIKFESLGTCGKHAPHLGRKGNAIPSGLVGLFTAYNEQWKVEIRYDAHEHRQSESGVTCVTWSITNLHSMHTISRKETIDEANTRERNGRTITNQVCKQALQKRAMELETLLKETTNPERLSSLIADIKALRPARFTQGPLYFGLLHRRVQLHVQAQIV